MRSYIISRVKQRLYAADEEHDDVTISNYYYSIEMSKNDASENKRPFYNVYRCVYNIDNQFFLSLFLSFINK